MESVDKISMVTVRADIGGVSLIHFFGRIYEYYVTLIHRKNLPRRRQVYFDELRKPLRYITLTVSCELLTLNQTSDLSMGNTIVVKGT